MSFNYFEELSGEDRSRYLAKIKLINMKECPYKMAAGVWKNSPNEWPELEYGNVYNYLINSPGIYTRESMNTYKSLEAHNFFRSGWVQTVFSYKPPDSTHILLRADVKPSQRVNDDPHHPWIALTKDGTVSAAHCDCLAGLAESCSHVAALMFKVEAAVRLGYTKTTCTEEPCKWNNDFVKKVMPKPVAQVNFYKESAVQRAKQRARRRKQPYTESTPAEQERILQSMQKLKSAPVVLSSFNGYSESFHWKQVPVSTPKIPLSYRCLYNEDNLTLNETELQNKCDTIKASLSISDNQIKYIYDVTCHQSNSLVWHQMRTGRITSSTVHRLLHTNIENPAPSLVQMICSEQNPELHTKPILWGREHEKDALKTYEQIKMSDDPPHKNVHIERPGLLISRLYPYLGASSDAVWTCDCHEKSVVEVKCPYSIRESTLKEFLESQSSFLTDKKLLKADHQYYSQVQLQMYIHNAKKCDFVVWTPTFTVITTVVKNDNFILKMLQKCDDFFNRCILPELLTRRLEHSKTCATPDVPQKLFCVCRAPDDGRAVMIGCDNPTCKIQWYHLECIKKKRAPKGSWICMNCKKH